MNKKPPHDVSDKPVTSIPADKDKHSSFMKRPRSAISSENLHSYSPRPDNDSSVIDDCPSFPLSKKIKPETLHHLYVAPPLSITPTSSFTLPIKTLLGMSFDVDVALNQSIEDLKFDIFERTGILPDSQILLLNGSVNLSFNISPQTTLGSIGCNQGAFLVLLTEMKGSPYELALLETPSETDTAAILSSALFSSFSQRSTGFEADESSQSSLNTILGLKLDPEQTDEFSFLEDPVSILSGLRIGSNHSQDPTSPLLESIIASNQLSYIISDVSLSSDIESSTSLHCFQCKKKLRLTNRFHCKCQYYFCGYCRYTDRHPCPVDYLALGKAQLAAQNPLITKDKLNLL